MIPPAKALELFLQDIVTSASSQASKQGAKKISAYHLKRAVHETATLDFLKDIVEGVPDPLGTAAATVGAGGVSATLPPSERAHQGAGTSAGAASGAVTKRPARAGGAMGVVGGGVKSEVGDDDEEEEEADDDEDQRGEEEEQDDGDEDYDDKAAVKRQRRA